MVYRLQFDSLLSFVDTADYAILKRWKNPLAIEGWQTLKLTSQADLARQQVMGLHTMMVWEVELAEKLMPLIGTACQALAVDIDDLPYLALHITQSVDCLDPIHSQFKRFKNRNIGVEHYVLRADRVGDAHLFTIPDDGYSAIFASATFKAMFEQYQGSGLSFSTSLI